MDIHTISHASDRKKILKDFYITGSLWITADIKSVLYIKEYLRSHQNLKDLPPKDSVPQVKRATQFWTELMMKALPQYQLVDRVVMIFIYKNWAASLSHQWQKSTQTADLVCQYIYSLAHLLQHPLRKSLIAEWKQQKNISVALWEVWYPLLSRFWDYLMSIRVIEATWSSAFLIDQIPFQKIAYKKIIFDLHFEILPIEADLIREFSRQVSTHVLVPVPLDKKSSVYSIYDSLSVNKFLEKKCQIEETAVDLKNVKIKKFETTLAEVKDIICQIRQAVDKGISLEKISVLAPQIEQYWPCLKSFLEKEKIAVHKRPIVLLSHFPIIQWLFAQMETHLEIFKQDNLEIILSYLQKPLSFSRFKSEFSGFNCSSVLDSRLCKNKEELVRGEEFVNWLWCFRKKLTLKTSFLLSKEIDSICNKMRQIKTKLSWLDWISLWKRLIVKTEVSLGEGVKKGISVLSFNAISFLDSEFIYIAGLNEQSMKDSRLISLLQVEAVKEDLGFVINISTPNKLENAIACFIEQNSNKEIILSYSSSDFLGEPLSPSCLWLRKSNKEKKLVIDSLKGQTAWDKQQRKPCVKEILETNSSFAVSYPFESIERVIKEDSGSIPKVALFQKKINQLSPSSIEQYIKCPFIFKAQRLFNLWDGPERDVDLPVMDRGRLLHQLFEKLTLWSVEELSGLEKILAKLSFFIDKIKTEDFTLKKLHPVIWEKEKSYLLNKARLFLAEEMRKKKIMTNYRVIACEKEYISFWSFKTRRLNKKGEVQIKGKIDRIDSNGKAYQVIDYKYSDSNTYPASSWKNKKLFQMPFYITALEKGLAGLPAYPVHSALYLICKNFEYQGIALKDLVFIKLLNSDRKKSLMSIQEKKETLDSIYELINETIIDIYKGHFPAKPQEFSLCNRCRWRKICRAPHLN